MTHALTRWDALKILGLLLMFVDHAGYFYYTDQEWIRGIGRACAPIFFFLAGFAPHYKKDLKLLALALLLTAVDWTIKGTPNTLNILWSFLIIRVILAMLEARGLFVLKLHEWVIGALALVPVIVITQYGSLGLLLALSGYVYKHRAQYAANTPQRFFWFTTVLYGTLIATLSSFKLLTILAMVPSLLLMGFALQWFVKSPRESVPCPASGVLRLCARYTAIIYVAHLLALMFITGKPL